MPHYITSCSATYQWNYTRNSIWPQNQTIKTFSYWPKLPFHQRQHGSSIPNHTHLFAWLLCSEWVTVNDGFSFRITNYNFAGVTHIPRQSVVEIEQNSHQVLRFQISSENLAPIDIRYNLNENTTAFQPRSTLNYTAVHSAIVIQACSDIVNISETCRELWVTVQGKPELNNTSINLVLLMGEPQNIRRLNVTSSITVKISSRTVNIEGN